MTKIVHIYKSYYPDTTGGVEQAIKHIVAYKPHNKYKHTLLTCTPNKSHFKQVDALAVHYYHQNFCQASTPISYAYLRNFRRNIEEADIIHAHYPWPFADVSAILSFTQKPIIISYHSDIIKQKWLNYFYKPLQHLFFKKTKKIVVATPTYLETSRNLVAHKKKCVIVPYGISQAEKTNTKILLPWQQKLSKKFILFVGVLRYYKGLQYLVEAAQHIDCDIVIAGKGPMETDLKKQASKQGSTNIKFLGFISDEDKNALLSLCTAFVLPSHLRSEAFGICLLEAMQHSKPLITTEIGTGTSYVNQHKHTGFVVPPQDPQAIADAANHLLQNSAICKKLGDNAFQRFQTTFTAKKMSQTYHDLYDKLLIT